MKYLGSVENSYFDWLIERSWVRVPFTRNGEVECDSSVGRALMLLFSLILPMDK